MGRPIVVIGRVILFSLMLVRLNRVRRVRNIRRLMVTKLLCRTRRLFLIAPLCNKLCRRVALRTSKMLKRLKSRSVLLLSTRCYLKKRVSSIVLVMAFVMLRLLMLNLSICRLTLLVCGRRKRFRVIRALKNLRLLFRLKKCLRLFAMKRVAILLSLMLKLSKKFLVKPMWLLLARSCRTCTLLISSKMCRVNLILYRSTIVVCRRCLKL